MVIAALCETLRAVCLAARMLLTLCFLSQQPRCVLEIVLHGTTHGGAHLLACKLHANRSAEKTRALPEASFLEAVKLEACRLDRSGGSLYDAFAAGCPLPQCRSTSSHLANHSSLFYATAASFGASRACRYAVATPRCARDRERVTRCISIFSQLHFTWPRLLEESARQNMQNPPPSTNTRASRRRRRREDTTKIT